MLEAGTCWTSNELLTLSAGVVRIEEDVTIDFGPDGGIALESGAQLLIEGAREAPVKLRSGATDDDWRGGFLDSSQGSDRTHW